MHKTLIIGSKSFLAKYYISKYLKNFSKIFITSHKSTQLNLKYDLANPGFNILSKIIDTTFKYAIIFAGLSQIDFCEKEKDYSYKCNVTGTIKTAQFLCAHNIIPIIFSSDYVFDGMKGNYSEESYLNPLNEYGKQKAELEYKIKSNCKNNFIIIRLSKVFDHTYNKKNFLGNIITNLINGNTMNLSYDQIFSPIYVKDLIEIIFYLQTINYRGLINIGGKESINRYNLAQNIIQKYNLNNTCIKKISVNELNKNIKKPKNISLNCNKLYSYLKYELNPINWHIKRLVEKSL